MIAVISHDAGGAEILSSWLQRTDEPYMLVLDGPAIQVFERKIGTVVNHSLEYAIENSDWLLTGTSWQSDLEISAIKLARRYGKQSISFLDHWVNYQQRFETDNGTCFPDEIWVGDQDAYRIATQQFPDLKISLKPNPYFEDIKRQFEEIEHARGDNEYVEPYILYLCSPIKTHALKKYGDERYWGFTEEDAIRFFITNLKYIDTSVSRLLLRPHPSEEEGKYNWAISEFKPYIDVTIGGDKSLIHEIYDAKIVAGFNSMGMVVARIGGKRVINALPPGKIQNTLPISNIEQLDQLVSRTS